MKMSDEVSDVVPVYDADAANDILQLYLFDPRTKRIHRVRNLQTWAAHGGENGLNGRYSWYSVGCDDHGPFRVSTVFLGIDHNVFNFEGGPLVFETCVFFRNGSSEVIDRYASWWEAIQAHELISLDYQLRWRSVIAAQLAMGLITVGLAVAFFDRPWWRLASGFSAGSIASMYLLWFKNWYRLYLRLVPFRAKMRAKLRAALRGA